MKRFSVCLAGCAVFLLVSCGRCDVSIGDIVRWGLVRKPLSPIECPVFNIPLDGWSEFELKASTNNYRTGVAAVDMVYWFESLGCDAYGGAWTNCPGADLNASSSSRRKSRSLSTNSTRSTRHPSGPAARGTPARCPAARGAVPALHSQCQGRGPLHYVNRHR